MTAPAQGGEIGNGADDDARRERQSTLIAQAAIAGIVVSPRDDGSFILRHWAYSRRASDLDELEQALRLQGAVT
jgi:hypothetical protein